MSLALGRLILSPSDLSLRYRNNPTSCFSPNFLRQSRRRRKNHDGEDANVTAFGLRLCSDGVKSVLPTLSSCSKSLKRFPMYFRRQSFAAAVIPGGVGSTLPEDYDFDHDGLDGGGGDGGKKDGGEGGGGSFDDGGDSRLDGYPIWWWWVWWQWQKQRGSRNGTNFNRLIEMVLAPEELTSRERTGDWKQFVEKVKKYRSDILDAILQAILTPFAFLAIAIVEPRLRDSYVPYPFTFFVYFNDVMLVTMQLVLGTALLISTLLLWWIWRRLHRSGSAGEGVGDQQQDSGEDSGDDRAPMTNENSEDQVLSARQLDLSP